MEIISGDECFRKLDSKQHLFYYFSAGWCKPCQEASPQIEELAKQYDVNQIKFLKVDMDDNDKNTIEQEITDTLSWLENNQDSNVDEYKSKKNTLEQKINPIMMKLYQRSTEDKSEDKPEDKPKDKTEDKTEDKNTTEEENINIEEID